MARFEPERFTVRLRNGTVTAVAADTVTLQWDGNKAQWGGVPPNKVEQSGIPVHGPMPTVGMRVLVMEQGSSLIVMGDPVSLQDDINQMRKEMARQSGLIEALRMKAGI